MTTLAVTIPALFLKKGRNLQQVKPEQCAELMEVYRAGRGASEMRKPFIDLFDADGARIGEISYNGRVWYDGEGGRVEVPVRGVKTCAQRDAEGWSSDAAMSDQKCAAEAKFAVTNNWDDSRLVVDISALRFLGIEARLLALNVGESYAHDEDKTLGVKLEFFETYTRIS